MTSAEVEVRFLNLLRHIRYNGANERTVAAFHAVAALVPEERQWAILAFLWEPNAGE